MNANQGQTPVRVSIFNSLFKDSAPPKLTEDQRRQMANYLEAFYIGRVPQGDVGNGAREVIKMIYFELVDQGRFEQPKVEV